MGCFLATVWEGKRKKEEREGPGHSRSDGSPENRLFLLPPWQRKYKREGAAKHIPLEGLYPSSLVPHLPVLPIDSLEAEVGGMGGDSPGGDFTVRKEEELERKRLREELEASRIGGR